MLAIIGARKRAGKYTKGVLAVALGKVPPSRHHGIRDGENAMSSIKDQHQLTGNQVAELLSETTVRLAPRLFALYGLRNGTEDEEMDTMIGWGMDFGEDRGAVFYLPDENSTWRSESAESLHAIHQLFGDIRLRWLYEPPTE
jgi:hypothetical protein